MIGTIFAQMFFFGEDAGNRTQDQGIKSPLLYRWATSPKKINNWIAVNVKDYIKKNGQFLQNSKKVAVWLLIASQ